jgi:hypothetical protein
MTAAKQEQQRGGSMTTSHMSAMVLRRLPLRHPLLPVGRGHRLPQTLLAISERDHLLRECADHYCAGMSDRAAAATLHTALTRYRDGRWRRDRSEATCPVQHQGKLTALLYALLRTRDHVLSEMTIRRALAFRDPANASGCTSMEVTT